jgi:CHAD domain-containing protein
MPIRSKSIYEFYKDLGDAFLKHLKGSATGDGEKIHKLRVSIKNIRAFLGLLEILTKDASGHKNLLKVLSPVFKKAGKTRTASLNIRLTEDQRSKAFIAFRRSLEKIKVDSEYALKKEIKQFDKKAFGKWQRGVLKKTKAFEQKNAEQVIHSHIQSLFTKITTLLPKYGDDKLFHGIRKKFKNIKTLTKILIHLSPSDTNKKEFSRITAIEEKIGQWHDKVVLSETLEKFIQKHKRSKGLEKISDFILNLKDQTDKDKAHIVKQLKKTKLLKSQRRARSR